MICPRLLLILFIMLLIRVTNQGQPIENDKPDSLIIIEAQEDLRENEEQLDTVRMLAAAMRIKKVYQRQNIWDSTYHYNNLISNYALAVSDYKEHIEALIDNVFMDRMFGRNKESIQPTMDYLRSFLSTEKISIVQKSHIANMLAGHHYRIGAVDSMLYYQKMNINLSDQEDDENLWRVHGRLQIASYLREIGQSSEAIQYLIDVESIFEIDKLTPLKQIQFYRNMAGTLIDIGDINSAEEYLVPLKKVLDQTGYESMYESYYVFSADISKSKGDFRQAQKQYFKGLKSARKGKNQEKLQHLWQNIARGYYHLQQVDSMKIYLDSISSISVNFNDYQSLNFNILQCQYYLKKRNYSKAKDFLNVIEDSFDGTDIMDVSVAKLKHEYYNQIGDKEKAYQYYQEFIQVKDSIVNKQNIAVAKAIESKYNRDKQDAEIELLSIKTTAQDKAIAVRNTTIVLGSIMLGILGLLLFGLYRLFRKNQESQLLLAQQNEAISNALEQNQILVKEIHHRVKNNLQVVSSLLSLQERKVDDEATKEALKSSQTRVQTMSLIHKSLYQKDDVRSIDIKTYFKQLTENLVRSFAIHPVDLKLDIDEMNIDIDSLVPLGLVANELICNALKHGIHNMNNGVLSVSLKDKSDQIILSVEDNGGNLGKDQLIRKEGSLGTRLIQAFTDNLEGELTVRGGDTTKISLTVEKDKIIFSDL